MNTQKIVDNMKASDKLSCLEMKKDLTLPPSVLDRIGFKITGYELDGTIIIIHTNQDFACHLETGTGCVNFYDWLAGYLNIESDEVYDWIENNNSDEINELAEMYANDNTDQWQVVEP